MITRTKEYLQLLEQAVETLDTTIRRIVGNVDEMVNSTGMYWIIIKNSRTSIQISQSK
jgi:hypothetical protein